LALREPQAEFSQIALVESIVLVVAVEQLPELLRIAGVEVTLLTYNKLW